jgi:predicted transcriptional regulator
MAATTTIRVDTETRTRLMELARREHKPIGEVVAEAVERYEEDQFWAEYQAGYARLRDDPQKWSAWKEVLNGLDGVIADGLE